MLLSNLGLTRIVTARWRTRVKTCTQCRNLNKNCYGEIDSHPWEGGGGQLAPAPHVVIHAVGRGAGCDFHRELLGPLSGLRVGLISLPDMVLGSTGRKVEVNEMELLVKLLINDKIGVDRNWGRRENVGDRKVCR